MSDFGNRFCSFQNFKLVYNLFCRIGELCEIKMLCRTCLVLQFLFLRDFIFHRWLDRKSVV